MNALNKPDLDAHYEDLRGTTKALHVHLTHVRVAMETLMAQHKAVVEGMRAVARHLTTLCHEAACAVPTTVAAVVDQVHIEVETLAGVTVPAQHVAWQAECVERLNTLVASLAALKTIKDERKKRAHAYDACSAAIVEKERTMEAKGKSAGGSKTYGPLKQHLEAAHHEFVRADAVFKSTASRTLDGKNLIIASVLQGFLYSVCHGECSIGAVFARLYDVTVLHQGEISV